MEETKKVLSYQSQVRGRDMMKMIIERAILVIVLKLSHGHGENSVLLI
jgi:hypothetical protein